MKHLQNILGDIRRWFASLSLKRVTVIAIAAVLITAPTAVAVGYVIHNEVFKAEAVTSVALYNEKDELIISKDGQSSGDTSPLVSDIFLSLTDSPTPIELDMSTVESGRYIKAVITENSITSELRCYFSTDNDEGYYTDAKGQAFVISAELNRRFLATEYAESFYDSALCHTLTTVDGDTILPMSTEWFYRSTSGEFLTARKNKLATEQNTYEITGALDIRFDSEPDVCTVQVYQGSECIYSGDEKKLASLTIDSKEELRVTVHARWKNEPNSVKYGDLNYDFLVHIKNRSSFYINKDTVYSGGFVILDCTNITDISKIKFETEKESISPVFRRYSGTVRTVIPFPESDTPEIFDFSVSYGASSQSFSVNILPAKEGKEYSVPSLLFENENTPKDVYKKIKSTLFTSPLPQNDLIYFRGNFLDPTQNGFYTAYTHNGTVLWGEELEYSYTVIGNEYITSAPNTLGASVATAQNGIVALVGSNKELGNYVVIDHGCGLRTWYAGLGSIDVSINDIVLVGQHIGKAGKSTIDGKEGFKLFCTADDIIIDPNNLW